MDDRARYRSLLTLGFKPDEALHLTAVSHDVRGPDPQLALRIGPHGWRTAELAELCFLRWRAERGDWSGHDDRTEEPHA